MACRQVTIQGPSDTGGGGSGGDGSENGGDGGGTGGNGGSGGGGGSSGGAEIPIDQYLTPRNIAIGVGALGALVALRGGDSPQYIPRRPVRGRMPSRNTQTQRNNTGER